MFYSWFYWQIQAVEMKDWTKYSSETYRVYKYIRNNDAAFIQSQ